MIWYKTKFQENHGLSKIPEYYIWCCMIGRCRDKTNTSYPWYGGKGITVCKKWLNSFVAFIRDMKPRPSPKHSIDRKNTQSNYNSRNCRWATKLEQSINRQHGWRKRQRNNFGQFT